MKIDSAIILWSVVINTVAIFTVVTDYNGDAFSNLLIIVVIAIELSEILKYPNKQIINQR